MNKELDIKIENKKRMLDEAISEYNFKNNSSDSILISKYTKDLKELLDTKAFYFEIEPETKEVTPFHKFVLFNGKKFESDSLIRLLNDLIETRLSGKRLKLENTELKEMLRNFDVIKSTKSGLSHKSNSFEIFYRKIFKAAYGDKWQEFSKI